MSKIDKARELRKNATDAEKLLWRRLRMGQVESYKFRRQQPIGEHIVDFVCAERKLIIEVDGGQHVEQAESDESRSKWLQAQGYRVLRFWNHDVLTMPDAVLTSILQELDKSGYPPLTSVLSQVGRGGMVASFIITPSPLVGEGGGEGSG